MGRRIRYGWPRWRWGCAGRFGECSRESCRRATLEQLSRRFKDRGIPWQFVDVIEVDPARRVKLRIEYERLAEMHPSDLAEILEDLSSGGARRGVYVAG